jgi:hypothetical protein
LSTTHLLHAPRRRTACMHAKLTALRATDACSFVRRHSSSAYLGGASKPGHLARGVASAEPAKSSP